jgi:hypothetical protein
VVPVSGRKQLITANQKANTDPPEVPNKLIMPTYSDRQIGANSDLRPSHNLARNPASAIGPYTFDGGVDAA